MRTLEPVILSLLVVGVAIGALLLVKGILVALFASVLHPLAAVGG